ncbi:hypothetical protein PVAND_008493 [Polypedilum vanderplanki]|uniref:Sodium channel protein Nach n=1 Tax=Polypedilum vanderplanki TaxID=319348 RepID=A0A9J6CB83_POLVA|nr:hypothetical protein PVAND_008493 [Polypedilum vanderplanki]
MDIVCEVKRTVVDTFHEISVHGFIFLVKRGNNILERIIWLFCICIGVYGIIKLGSDTWNRYQTSPTVISMDRSKFSWNTSFPSLTICSDKRIDDDKLEEYLEANPEKFPNDESKENARKFIKKLSLISYSEMDEFPLGLEGNIKTDEYLQLMNDLKWNFHPEISSGTSNKLIMQQMITENGICDSVNSKVAYYNQYSYWKANRWDIVKPNLTVVVHPLDGEIYAQLTNLSTAYSVFFHGAMEIPDISKIMHRFPQTDYTTVEFLALEILTSPDAKKLSPSQRNCRLETESEELLTSTIYSFNLCRSQCRFKMALKECKCVPYFYRNVDKRGRKYPVCGPEGMRCIGKMKDEIITLKSTTKKIDCDCMANCDNSNFFTQSIRSRVWFLGANLQWGIIDYPKLQLKRELLFGLSDVLVYIGGLGGLFLGCSLLGFTELIFFFTWGLLKNLFHHIRNKMSIDIKT